VDGSSRASLTCASRLSRISAFRHVQPFHHIAGSVALQVRGLWPGVYIRIHSHCMTVHIGNIEKRNHRAIIDLMKRMLTLFIRCFAYAGISWYLLLLTIAVKTAVTQPLNKLACNVRTNWSDFDPLVYPVHCTSKIQYLLFAVIVNPFNPLSLTIWFFLGLVVFVSAVIFLSLRYKPD